MLFCCSICIETAQNSGEECNEFADLFVLKTIIMPFKRLFVLSHSLIRSLYFIPIYIFIPLTHSAPFLCFSHTLLYTNFFLCILPREILFLSLMTLSLGIEWYFLIEWFFLISPVKGPVWTIFFFLTFIALIQWNFPWNISANLLIFTNKASSHVVIV